MQPVEVFIGDFLRDQIIEEQREMRSRAPFRLKYFADGCQYNSRLLLLSAMQSEKVESISGSNSNPIVITMVTSPYFRPGYQLQRKRYHLKPAGDNWMIEFVESACPFCQGRGDSSCIFCKGMHWQRLGLSGEDREGLAGNQ